MSNLSGKTLSNTVILIKSANTDKIFSRIRKFFSQEHLLVFFNLEVPRQFQRGDLNTKSSEEYLSKADYQAIDEYVFGGLSKDWYLYKNLTEYHGIPMGRICEYDFQKYLVPRIKNLEIIRRIVESENAARIIVLDDTDELREVVKFYAQLQKIPWREMPLIPVVRFFSRIIKNSFAKYLSKLLDSISYKRLRKIDDAQGLVLMDFRLYKYFKDKPTGPNFLLAPFEKGLRLRRDLLNKRFTYLPFYFYKSKDYPKDTAALIKRWQEVSAEDDFRRIFIYRGVPIWRLVFKRLNNLFLQDFCRIAANVNLIEKIIREKKIKKAVLRNDTKELERTVIFTLRQNNISSLVVQHGILAEPNGHNKLVADKFAAWGRATVEWYAQFGNPAEAFKVVGNPNFDGLLNWKPPFSREQFCLRLNLDPQKSIILLATQQINKFSSFWTDDLFLVMSDKVLTAMQKLPNNQLIIKVDPSEETAPYRDMIQRGSYKNVTAVKDIDIYTLLFLSELVITLDSTVGLEAMLFDKPLITINLTKREDRVPYAEQGAAIGVYGQDDLLPVIKSVLSEQKTISRLRSGRKQFIEKYSYRIDGKAKERFSYLVNGLKRL